MHFALRPDCPVDLGNSMGIPHGTLTCKIKVSNSISIRKFQNNPQQCGHPKTYNFRNVFERCSSRFESFSERFGSFSHHLLRLFGVVVVATLFSASSSIDRSQKFQNSFAKMTSDWNCKICIPGPIWTLLGLWKRKTRISTQIVSNLDTMWDSLKHELVLIYKLTKRREQVQTLGHFTG